MKVNLLLKTRRNSTNFAVKWGLGNISKVTIIDPETFQIHEEYVHTVRVCKKKGMTIIEEACHLDFQSFLVLRLFNDRVKSADGQFAGARKYNR